MDDNKHTMEDLRIMQSWSLERKIRVTQTRIIEWYQHWGGNVVVSLSGGKDSTILLDLARRIYPDIPAIFVDTTMEFVEIREFVKSIDNVKTLKPSISFQQIVEKYGYPVISKEQANYINRIKNDDECMKAFRNGVHKMPDLWLKENMYNIPFKFLKCLFGLRKKTMPILESTGVMPKSKYAISKKWQYLIDSPFKISDRCCYHLKKAPIAKHLRKTGAKAIVATLADESMLRTQHWLKSGCNAFDAKEQKSSPMSFWTEQDVLRYLKLTGIPYCKIYGDIVEENNILRTTLYNRTGCWGCLFGAHLEEEPNRLQMLKITHPKQYAHLINDLDYKSVCDFIGIKY